MKYLYGPVPSRRLGRSLGLDIVPFKYCTLDCIYCQLGRTTNKTIERKEYVPIEPVLAELKARLAQGLEVDFISISGSGEPTLNSRLGELLDEIKKITKIPVAVLTNGTLLYRQDVRADCAKADVVLPSLDAADEKVFRKINRPHKDISIDKLIEGLCAFRNEFAGQIWLEVFFVKGLNTDAEQIARLRDIIKRVCPDKVQLNTAVRPTAETDVPRLSPEKLQQLAKDLGPNCEVVADLSLHRCSGSFESQAEYVLSMLKRRPCSINDICSALGIPRNEAVKYITHFQQKGLIDSRHKDGKIFYKAN